MMLLKQAVPAAVLAADSTVVNYGAATACQTYCYGFTTDCADVTVVWINPNYNGTLIFSINGVVHSGHVVYGVVSVISDTYPITTIQQATDVEIQAADGSNVLATVVLRQTTRPINSGRAHYYLTTRYVPGGSITFP